MLVFGYCVVAIVSPRAQHATYICTLKIRLAIVSKFLLCLYKRLKAKDGLDIRHTLVVCLFFLFLISTTYNRPMALDREYVFAFMMLFWHGG